VSRRVFATIRRGMTDATAVCVFPWELDILALVHGQEVKEVSIDEMCSLNGAVKVEKQKLKHSTVAPPDLRAQLEIMAYVDPEEDPANDPASEYNRMAEKYGMDKELPIACVTRVYGEFTSGAFEAKLREHAQDVAPRPAPARDLEDMSVKELRAMLTDRGIEWKPTESKAALIEKLQVELA